MILDNAPARSFELLNEGRVNGAIVPVIASQMIDGVRLIPDVCVGAAKSVRSVCLATRGADIENAETVALDTSSKTSVILTKLIFREFFGREPQWVEAKPDIGSMLEVSDAALLIGDPAFTLDRDEFRVFDLVELWRKYTDLGFVFAMWMTRDQNITVDLAAARNEGLDHIDEIAQNYCSALNVDAAVMTEYLTQNISYSIDPEMAAGLELYIDLAEKNGLIEKRKDLRFID